jgi:hypothetical protein
VGWTRLALEAGPAPREDHTWSIDPDSGIAYLFGGRTVDRQPLGDLWAYDLAADAWTELTIPGPAPRFGHEAEWVPGVGLVVFAGQAGSTFFNDLWTYDPSAAGWRQLLATGAVPVPRYGTCAAVGADGRLWISHGFTQDGNRFADTVAYDFASGGWADETPVGDAPGARCLHGCWWTDADRFVLYAGQTTGVTALGDRWELTRGERPGTNTWAQLSGTAPPERNLYAYARVAGATLVAGGQAIDGSYLADAWLLPDGAPAQPLELGGEAPQPRAGAELISDDARERLLLFGGRDADETFGEVSALTLP